MTAISSVTSGHDAEIVRDRRRSRFGARAAVAPAARESEPARSRPSAVVGSSAISSLGGSVGPSRSSPLAHAPRRLSYGIGVHPPAQLRDAGRADVSTARSSACALLTSLCARTASTELVADAVEGAASSAGPGRSSRSRPRSRFSSSSLAVSRSRPSNRIWPLRGRCLRSA